MDSNPDAGEVTVSEVNLFEKPPTVVGLVGHEDLRIYPESGWKNSWPGFINFTIEDSKKLMTQANWTLTMSWKVVNGEGESLKDTDKVSTINLPHLCFFRDVNLKVGNSHISGSDGMFPYKSYLEFHLAYSKEAKDTWLQSLMFYKKDTAGLFNTFEPGEEGSKNEGYEFRKTKIASSRLCETRGRLPLDLSQAERYLIPGVAVTISLVHASDAFRLLTPDDAVRPKVVIENIYLSIRRVMVSAGLYLSIEQRLNSGQRAIYPLRRSVIISQQIVQGSTTFNTTVFLGQKPSFVLIAFVRSDAYTGYYSRNPFCMDNCAVEFIQMNFEGNYYPMTPYVPKFSPTTKGQISITELYEEFQKLCGTLYTNTGNDLTTLDYANGTTLFPFNLSEFEPSAQVREPFKEGRTRLDVRFGTGLTHNYHMIAAGYFYNEMTISQERVVSVNYQLGGSA